MTRRTRGTSHRSAAAVRGRPRCAALRRPIDRVLAPRIARREWYQWLIRRRAATLRAGDLTLQARADHVEDTKVIEAVSEAYARKYGEDASVGRMFLARARRSTLELLLTPAEGGTIV